MAEFVTSLYEAASGFLPGGFAATLDSFDEALPAAAPKGTAFLVTLLITIYMARLLGSMVTGGASSGSKRKTGNKVLFTGMSGSGKTTMFHKLAFNTTPATVTSTAEAVAEVTGLHGEEDETAKKYTLVDFPGHERLRGRPLYQHAAESVAVVVVVDATASGAEAMRLTAEMVYDLLTDAGVVESAPYLLFACNKSDENNALSPEQIQAKLEASLEVLKTTRGSLGTTNEQDDNLRLGRKGHNFSFAKDSPCEVAFAACSVTAEQDGLGAVRKFVEEAFE